MQYLPTLSNENPREEDSAVGPTRICSILQRIFSSQNVRTTETLSRFIVTVCSNGKGLPARSNFAKSPRPFSLSLFLRHFSQLLVHSHLLLLTNHVLLCQTSLQHLITFKVH
jgi:hypothetical protein